MATNSTKLIQALKRRQRDLELSDTAIAKRLGVSPSFWCLVQQGKRRIGHQLIRGVIRGFPELTTEALIFLRSEVTDTTSAGHEGNCQATEAVTTRS